MLKFKDILEFPSTYQSIASVQMPAKLAYKLAVIARTIAPELEYYQTTVSKLAGPYVSVNEDGTSIIPPENVPELNEKISEILDMDIGSNPPHISSSELELLEALDMTPAQMMTLLPFITE